MTKRGKRTEKILDSNSDGNITFEELFAVSAVSRVHRQKGEGLALPLPERRSAVFQFTGQRKRKS